MSDFPEDADGYKDYSLEPEPYDWIADPEGRIGPGSTWNPNE